MTLTMLTQKFRFSLSHIPTVETRIHTTLTTFTDLTLKGKYSHKDHINSHKDSTFHSSCYKRYLKKNSIRQKLMREAFSLVVSGFWTPVIYKSKKCDVISSVLYESMATQCFFLYVLVDQRCLENLSWT